MINSTITAPAKPALHPEQDMYRVMVEAVQDYAILRLDPEGHVASWNAGAQRFKGYRADEIIGQSFEVFYLPEDRAAGKPFQLLRQAIRDGRCEDEGYRLRKDGTPFWADVVITALYDDAGTLTGFSKVTRDLTERRRHEEEVSVYQTMVEAVQDYAILRLDADGHVASWNAGAQRFKGYRADEIIGQSFEVFYPPEARAAGKPKQLLQQAIRDGRCEDEGFRVRKDGTLFWADVVITALHNSAGNLIGFSKVTRDLTERRKAEEALRQHALDLEHANQQAEAARARAEKSDYVKSAFLASMSHELRTPLNAIINFTQFVAAGDLGEINDGQKELLLEVVDSSKHLLSLINDVLDMSKIESGALVLFVEDGHDVNAILNAALSTCRALVKPDVKLQVDMPDKLPTIRADRLRILQIVLNVLSNACKFTSSGTITVRAAQQDGHILIEVADTGSGIAPEDQAGVFTPFVQTETGLRQGGGSGLGMPIAKNLVEAHGGRIWLESTPGAGTTFSILLPILSPSLQLTQ